MSAKVPSPAAPTTAAEAQASGGSRAPSGTATSSSKPPRSALSTQHLFSLNTKALYFPPPYNRLIQNTLMLSNMSKHTVVFKLRSSDAVAFWARPKTGVLPANSTEPIRVVLLETANPPAFESCRFFIEGRQLASVPPAAVGMKDVWEGALQSPLFNFVLVSRTTSAGQLPEGVNVSYPDALPTSKRDAMNAAAAAAAPEGSPNTASAAVAALTAPAPAAAAAAVVSTRHQPPLPPGTGDSAARQQRAVAELKKAKAAGGAVEARREAVAVLGRSAAVKAGSSGRSGVRLSVAIFFIILSYGCGLFIGQDLTTMAAEMKSSQTEEKSTKQLK